jgi:hypothetical protein
MMMFQNGAHRIRAMADRTGSMFGFSKFHTRNIGPVCRGRKLAASLPFYLKPAIEP